MQQGQRRPSNSSPSESARQRKKNKRLTARQARDEILAQASPALDDLVSPTQPSTTAHTETKLATAAVVTPSVTYLEMAQQGLSLFRDAVLVDASEAQVPAPEPSSTPMETVEQQPGALLWDWMGYAGSRVAGTVQFVAAETGLSTLWGALGERPMNDGSDNDGSDAPRLTGGDPSDPAADRAASAPGQRLETTPPG